MRSRAEKETKRFVHPADGEPETIERRITKRVGVIDAHLLAIARGEIDPEDPFGGLILVQDKEETEEPCPPTPRFALQSVPQLFMSPEEIVRLPIDHRDGFLLSLIDGERTVEDLIDISRLPSVDVFETIDRLVSLGAVDLLRPRGFTT